eukprot:gene7656-11737_t
MTRMKRRYLIGRTALSERALWDKLMKMAGDTYGDDGLACLSGRTAVKAVVEDVVALRSAHDTTKCNLFILRVPADGYRLARVSLAFLSPRVDVMTTTGSIGKAILRAKALLRSAGRKTASALPPGASDREVLGAIEAKEQLLDTVA